MAPVLERHRVDRTYRMGAVTVSAPRPVDLVVGAGDMVVITGRSGSGKSTPMFIVGCLDRPSHDRGVLAGRSVDGLVDGEVAEVRNRSTRFVFQGFNRVPRWSALNNVEPPLVDRGMGPQRRRTLAAQALADVGLGDRMDHLLAQRSGGPRRRVAIARASGRRPFLPLADGPTGNLDPRAGGDRLALFQGLNDQGMTVVLVTHGPSAVRHRRRILRVADGLVTGRTEVAAPERLMAGVGAQGGGRA